MFSFSISISLLFSSSLQSSCYLRVKKNKNEVANENCLWKSTSIDRNFQDKANICLYTNNLIVNRIAWLSNGFDYRFNSFDHATRRWFIQIFQHKLRRKIIKKKERNSTYISPRITDHFLFFLVQLIIKNRLFAIRWKNTKKHISSTFFCTDNLLENIFSWRWLRDVVLLSFFLSVWIENIVNLVMNPRG